MSIIETNETKRLIHPQSSYCCRPKQYYSCHKSTLADSLQILPRIILYKTPLQAGKIYETTVTINNHGLHDRHLIYTTDSDDVSVQTDCKQLQSHCLESDKPLVLRIRVQPKTKLNINRRRHVFIQAEHPNIIFTIPIIIQDKKDVTPSLPDTITFPSCCIKSFTFYEMILYNKMSEKLQFSLKCNNPDLTIIVAKLCIPRRDYVRILLKLKCNHCVEVLDIIKMKVGVDSYDIPFVHEPVVWSLFLDTRSLQFDPLKFNRSATKSFRICNESSKHNIRFHLKLAQAEAKLIEQNFESKDVQSSIASGGSSSTTSSISQSQAWDNKCIDDYPWEHFTYQPKCGTLAPNTSSLITITFKPIMHSGFNPASPPPFTVCASLIVNSQDELMYNEKAVVLCGIIHGTDIDIKPKFIDFHNVFFGEEHCAHIEVSNVDDRTNCHVDFYDYIGHEEANVIVTPKLGIDLKPCASDLFHLQFYSKTVGKLQVKLKFKVRCGGFFYTTVRGYFQHVRVKCFPDILDMGILPVCVPQKRLVLVMNPLTVPITLQCSVPDDGSESPLVLNVIDTDEHLPIQVQDPVYHMAKCLQQENQDQFHSGDRTYRKEAGEEIQREDDYRLKCEDADSSLLSFRSVMDENSSCSTEFQENALDFIPSMAPNLLHYLKKIKIFDKPDMEKKIIEESLDYLLSTPYFRGMDKQKNYCNMDWNALPSDPKEIYCNNEIIYLNPNTGKAITVVVIPNAIGRKQRYLEFRVCPVIPPATYDEDPTLRQVVDSIHLKSKLWIEYNCSVPEVMWDNVIDMQDALYCGELYEFEMVFENCSKVGGFFYYEVIPDNEYGCMKFLNDRWKYFVEPGSVERVPCAVEFKRTGFIHLLGLIKFVGVRAGFPFHIKSEVLPPKIAFSPQQIVKKLPVLEAQSYYIYIDNVTPTTTWIRLKLKDDSHTRLYPQGAQLAPTGQGTYATLNVFYKDPGVYRNVLYLYMQYEAVEKISITLHVEGMPIFFEPEIRSSGLNMGHLLCNTKEDDEIASRPSYSRAVKIINEGERNYRIVITKTKCSAQPACSIHHTQTKVLVKPNCVTMEPMSEDFTLISAYAYEECSIYNEFRVDVIDVSEPTRKQTARFFLTGEFIYPQLTWHRREITMEYHRTHKFKEHDLWEILKLSNVSDNFMESVRLKVSGPFLLKEQFEHRYTKELEFSMRGLECKDIFVMLDKWTIRNRLNTAYEGRISCWANAKIQKAVHLKVRMIIPTINISNQDVVIFAKNIEGATYIELYNPGPTQAIYKWKKLQEAWRYFEEDDDSQQVAEIILSDIIRMLDLQNRDSYFDDSELNMSKRFRKYRCKLNDLPDPIDIKGILYEIIEDLDLRHKRYQLQLEDLSTSHKSDEETDKALSELVEKKTYVITPHRDSVTNSLQSQIDEAINMLNQKRHGQAMEEMSKIERQLNSRTLYFNRKFRTNPSSYCASDNNGPSPSSSGTCVYHTLDHVLGHLKLEDSYTISDPSSEACDAERSIYFYEKCGILEANQKELCVLHLPAVRRGFEVTASFQMDVIGGKSQNLRITCVNLDKALRLSKDSVYLGIKPWYETFRTKVKVENTTNYNINLRLLAVPNKPDKLRKLATGFIKIISEKKCLLLPALQSIQLKTEGIMGFCEEFMRDIAVTVDDGDVAVNVRLRGHGVMPMLAVVNHKMPSVEQDVIQVMEEYRLLQKIYYFEVFKAITEPDDEHGGPGSEENQVQQVLSCIMELSLSSSFTNTETKSSAESARSTARYEHEVRFFRLLQTFVLVNNNEELPNASVLNQYVETERFLNILRSSEEIGSLLQLVHQDYLKHLKDCDGKLLTNLKHLTVQPLPFQMRGIIWDLNKLPLNQYRKFEMPLEFFGPGKLIASVRTVAHMPGLLVDFQVVENIDRKDFTYYRSEWEVTESSENPYRNMNERSMDAQMDPKVKHAHSFDVNKRLQHQREISIKNRKWVMEHYNSLNKSVYMDRKHHITHCKIFTNSKLNFTGAKVNVVLLMKPLGKFYKHGQRIEDYLYIDLHMGPTLPLLLRGTIDENAKDLKYSFSPHLR